MISPALFCAFSGHVNMMKYLYESCEVDLAFITQPNEWNILHAACSGGSIDMMEYLLTIVDESYLDAVTNVSVYRHTYVLVTFVIMLISVNGIWFILHWMVMLQRK